MNSKTYQEKEATRTADGHLSGELHPNQKASSLRNTCPKCNDPLINTQCVNVECELYAG